MNFVCQLPVRVEKVGDFEVHTPAEVVSMVVHQETLYVATDMGIYRLDRGSLVPVLFQPEATPA